MVLHRSELDLAFRGCYKACSRRHFAAPLGGPSGHRTSQIRLGPRPPWVLQSVQRHFAVASGGSSGGGLTQIRMGPRPPWVLQSVHLSAGLAAPLRIVDARAERCRDDVQKLPPALARERSCMIDASESHSGSLPLLPLAIHAILSLLLIIVIALPAFSFPSSLTLFPHFSLFHRISSSLPPSPPFPRVPSGVQRHDFQYIPHRG